MGYRSSRRLVAPGVDEPRWVRRAPSRSSTDGNCVISGIGSMRRLSHAVHSKSSTTKWLMAGCTASPALRRRPLTLALVGGCSEPQPGRAGGAAAAVASEAEEAALLAPAGEAAQLLVAAVDAPWAVAAAQ